MNLAITLLIFAQSAAPQMAQESVISNGAASTSVTSNGAASTRPVAVHARASVRVLRPARIDFDRFEKQGEGQIISNAREAQRSRDAAGTPWIEFS